MKQLPLILLLITFILIGTGCQNFPVKWDKIYSARRDHDQNCWNIAQRMFVIWESCGEVKVERCVTTDNRLHALVWFRPFGEKRGKWYDTTMNISDTGTVLCTPINEMLTTGR